MDQSTVFAGCADRDNHGTYVEIPIHIEGLVCFDLNMAASTPDVGHLVPVHGDLVSVLLVHVPPSHTPLCHQLLYPSLCVNIYVVEYYTRRLNIAEGS